MRLLLTGIGGLYNYGCEAIVRGTHRVIRHFIPDADIVYASPRHESDQKTIADLDISVVRREIPKRFSPSNIMRKLQGMAGIKKFSQFDSQRSIENIDAVFSIGGDIYTLQNRRGDYNGSIVQYTDYCLSKGKKLILWGASVGPFSSHPDIEKLIINQLKRFHAITLREDASFDYLNSFGLNNIHRCADPAFLVEPGLIKTSTTTNNLIGINLSPLSALTLNRHMAEVLMLQSQTISKMIDRFHVDVLLIPHVVCPEMSNDDDLGYLLKLAQMVNKPQHVSVLQNAHDFIETKRHLVDCDLVIAARMHCAINAMTARVPTLLLSYSAKAKGMCRKVYDVDDYCFPIDFCSSSEHQNGFLETVEAILSHKEGIYGILNKSIPVMQEKAEFPIGEFTIRQK